VEKLRATAAQLLREAMRLSGDVPEDIVSGLSAERAASASFGRIRANPTTWALFKRGFMEARRSKQANTPQRKVTRPRAEQTGREPPRRASRAYQRHDVRDGPGRFLRTAVQFQTQQPAVQPVPQQPAVQPPATQPAEPPVQLPAPQLILFNN